MWPEIVAQAQESIRRTPSHCDAIVEASKVVSHDIGCDAGEQCHCLDRGTTRSQGSGEQRGHLGQRGKTFVFASLLPSSPSEPHHGPDDAEERDDQHEAITRRIHRRPSTLSRIPEMAHDRPSVVWAMKWRTSELSDNIHVPHTRGSHVSNRMDDEAVAACTLLSRR